MTKLDSRLHILGVRHHGPGCARALLGALNNLQPDIVIIEGPADAEAVLPQALDLEMKPPVALLIYAPAQPQQCAFYPYAKFSPEWQALQYALKHQLPLRFMDLPQHYQLALRNDEAESLAAQDKQTIRHDPLLLLAQAAGYQESELWWEHLVEQRIDVSDIFTAILEAMSALRQECEQRADWQESKFEQRREAYMRKTIRSVLKEGYQRIAVVCGAWHAPALKQMPTVKHDQALLKSLSKQKTQATWVPWTYGRLARKSGYGAGVQAPGWYHHLWHHGGGELTSPSTVTQQWLVKVAQCLRHQGLDISPAHVIEATRLTETLTALRDRAQASLQELNEAITTVLLEGDPSALNLVFNELIISQRLGQVPSTTPSVPLQKDLTQLQKSLRLKVSADPKDLDLDLRKEIDLARSQLFHRLNLLHIPWAEDIISQQRNRGTFRESWRLCWQPEFSINLIEAAIWGNTIASAATEKTINETKKQLQLNTLAELIQKILFADLPAAMSAAINQLRQRTACSSDIKPMMAALNPLAQTHRYGNVRSTDGHSITQLTQSLITRICIGLNSACSSLDKDAADDMLKQIKDTHAAIALLEEKDNIDTWQQTLLRIADNNHAHPLIQGYCCRTLMDCSIWDANNTAQRLHHALSQATAPEDAAAWVEGFLSDSGVLLLHDELIWPTLDNWMNALNQERFIDILPMLRRTFAKFTAAERRQMGEKLRASQIHSTTSQINPAAKLDQERAHAVLPVMIKLLRTSI